ncbi:ABC transporter permease [Kibdelosporangium persicum]|uniref:ABC-type multidrug transport system permease component n=1 Tax=Kibdelosporangium persicum TaxID=2698649 RepID=A0ABX2FHS5_9PSEU|nr:ABC transporter permease [Kibdelosporangium persicum]NRN70962.1 ABC-type multidrug transport system permease component [Kibdelosporangium persicum]
MKPALAAVRNGVTRGRIELAQSLSSPGDVATNFFFTLLLLTVMLLLRDVSMPGTHASLGSTMLASTIGLNIVLGGLVNLTQVLIVERQDGTLLRAKAIPHGVTGYLTGKVISVCGLTLIRVVLLMVAGVLLFDGVSIGGTAFWATVGWLLPLGLIAMMSFGMVLGSLPADSRGLGLMLLPIMGLTTLSGIFYPVTWFPEWMQWVAQVFPIYWVGLGMRSALLPDAMAAVEIAGSWRQLACAGVLGAWAVAGLAVARVALRRAAQSESGSSVAAGRARAMRRMR